MHCRLHDRGPMVSPAINSRPVIVHDDDDDENLQVQALLVLSVNLLWTADSCEQQLIARQTIPRRKNAKYNAYAPIHYGGKQGCHESKQIVKS